MLECTNVFCTRSKSCFGGLIEQSGYIVLVWSKTIVRRWSEKQKVREEWDEKGELLILTADDKSRSIPSSKIWWTPFTFASATPNWSAHVNQILLCVRGQTGQLGPADINSISSRWLLDTRIPSLLTYTNLEGTLNIVYFEVTSNFASLSYMM